LRCVHLNRVGDQCPDQALEGRQLCAFHARLLEDYDSDAAGEPAAAESERRSRFPVIYRLAALLLLLILLMQTFGSVRAWLDF
jgi:hypothetical protein